LLERRRQINDLVLYYKILNGHCDMVLNAVSSSTVFHVAIILNLANKRAALMFEFFFIVIQLSTHGTVYLILYSLHHQVIILKKTS